LTKQTREEQDQTGIKQKRNQTRQKTNKRKTRLDTKPTREEPDQTGTRHDRKQTFYFILTPMAD
jgi:hypothetical protein